MATDAEIALAPSEDAAQTGWNSCPSGSVVLHGISWKLYRRLRKLRENCNLRMIYDRGELEIMSPSRVHEEIARLLGTLVDVWALELDIQIVSCGAMTIRRSALQRGFEPDNCFYVQHEATMRDRKRINFKTAPPPDLAMEVELSRKLLEKTGIYAVYRVPELWRWSDNSLRVFALFEDGEYVARDASVAFPRLPIAKVEEIVRQLGTVGRTTLVRSFRDWIRENVKPG